MATAEKEPDISNESSFNSIGARTIINYADNISDLIVFKGIDEEVVIPKAQDDSAENSCESEVPTIVTEKAESGECGKNEQDDISGISIDDDIYHVETNEKFILKHDYSEEIVQLLPPDLVEDDKIDLNSMKVMCNNFFEENSCLNQNGDENFDDVNVASSEDLVSKDVTTETIKTNLNACWATKNNKTYDLCIPFSNLSKLMDKSFSGTSVFDDLPDELIVKIFSFLTTEELCLHAATVCRKWRAISQDHSLWRSLDFSACPLLSSLNFLWVIRRAPMLHRLILSGRSHITHPEVAIFTECCPLLQDIDFGFCDNLSFEMIKTVSENCPQLRKINVEGCEKMDDKSARCFIKCKELTHMNFSHCIALSNKAVAVISKGLPKVLSINLDGIDSMTDSAVECLVSKHFQHLQEVELDGAEISDIGIQQLSWCTQLKHLELSFSECLTDQALEYLKDLKNLENLRLRKGCDLSAEGLSTFFKSASLSKLKWLNLSECTHVNDEVVLDIVQACGVRLKELALSWCWFITDTGLISIVDHCSNMENLDLLGIDKIRGDCLDRVPEEMPKLKYLDLRQCNKIVDALIVDVVRRKPDLRVWNYYGEEFIHD